MFEHHFPPPYSSDADNPLMCGGPMSFKSQFLEQQPSFIENPLFSELGQIPFPALGEHEGSKWR